MSGFPYPGDGYDSHHWLIYDLVAFGAYVVLWILSSILFISTVKSLWVNIPRTSMMRSLGRTSLMIVYLVSLQSLVRAVYFLIVSGTRDTDESANRMLILSLFMLMLIPDWFYYTVFSIVVHYWMTLFYTSAGQQNKIVWARRVLYALNGIVYLSGILAVILASCMVGTRYQWAALFSYSTGIAALILACLSVYYGISLMRLFRKIPDSRRDIRGKIVGQIGSISAVCFICFVYRASYVLGYPTNNYGQMWRVATYLVFGEIVPIALLLLLFFYLPQRLDAGRDNTPPPLVIGSGGSQGGISTPLPTGRKRSSGAEDDPSSALLDSDYVPSPSRYTQDDRKPLRWSPRGDPYGATSAV